MHVNNYILHFCRRYKQLIGDLLDSLSNGNSWVFFNAHTIYLCQCLLMTVSHCSFVSHSRPWKFEHIAIGFLSLLLRDDHQLPPAAVLFFVKSLNHESLYVRKVRHTRVGTEL